MHPTGAGGNYGIYPATTSNKEQTIRSGMSADAPQRRPGIFASTSAFPASNEDRRIADRNCAASASNYSHSLAQMQEKKLELIKIEEKCFYRSDLASAAETGKINKVMILVHSGKDINSFTTGIRTPLYEAVTNNNKDVVLFLLKNNANPDAFGAGWNNPLCMATGKNGQIKIVEALLDNGANVHGNSSGWMTPICRAAFFGHADIVKLLIEHGGFKGRESDTGWDNPITQAARQGNTDIVEILLDAGADHYANNPPDALLTPIYQATEAWKREGKQAKHRETIELLESHILGIVPE